MSGLAANFPAKHPVDRQSGAGAVGCKGTPDSAQPHFPRIGPGAPWLAPLAGHTDLALRILCREQGAAVACSEMVSAKGLIYGQRSRQGDNGSAALLRTLHGPAETPQRRELLAEPFPAATGADAPLVVQLFGEDPEFLGQAVELLRAWGYAWFDLNLGCSVPKVVKTGAGSALARDMNKTLSAARAMIQAAGPLPPGLPAAQAGIVPVQGRVGFKLRLGWSQAEENYLELAKGLEQCGAGWLTLHPRYARQGFSGSAAWPALQKLRQAVAVPLLASGDLLEASAALRCLEQSGVDGVMFARGALHNPAIFREFLELLRQGEQPVQESPRCAAPEQKAAERQYLAERALFWQGLILRHAELARALSEVNPHCKRPGRDQKRPDSALLKMRGAIPRYVRELPGSRVFRIEMSRCESWEKFFALLEDFFGTLIGGAAPEPPQKG